MKDSKKTEETPSDEIIDIEEYSKAGKEPPKGAKYRIKVGKDTFVVDVECMLGKEILELAGKKPYNKYQLYLKVHGQQSRIVEYEERVCFTMPGIEKFTTIPLDPTDGSFK